jgi:hypothetical protein
LEEVLRHMPIDNEVILNKLDVLLEESAKEKKMVS